MSAVDHKRELQKHRNNLHVAIDIRRVRKAGIIFIESRQKATSNNRHEEKDVSLDTRI